MIRSVHERRAEAVIIVGGIYAQAAQHFVERMQRFVQIARRRVLAVENRQVLEMAVQRAANDVAQDGLTKVDCPVV